MSETKYFNLYKSRLSNLQQILSNLHNSIREDQSLQYLSDNELSKYRIDRINQIISEIITNERQCFLIKALVKCQELSNQIKNQNIEHIPNKQNSKEQMLQQQYQRMKDNYEIILRQKLRDNQKLQRDNSTYLKNIQDLKKHIENLQRENKIIQSQNCELKQKLCKKYQNLQNQLAITINQKQQLIKNMKQLQFQITSIKNQCLAKEKQKNQLKEEINKLKRQYSQIEQQKYQIKHQILQSSPAKDQINRNLQIEKLKQQVRRLQEQLCLMGNQYKIIKNGIAKFCLQSLKRCKKDILETRREILRECQSLSLDIEKQVNSYLKKISLTGNKPYPQKILRKINQIDNQLDYFLENHINT